MRADNNTSRKSDIHIPDTDLQQEQPKKSKSLFTKLFPRKFKLFPRLSAQAPSPSKARKNKLSEEDKIKFEESYKKLPEKIYYGPTRYNKYGWLFIPDIFISTIGDIDGFFKIKDLSSINIFEVEKNCIKAIKNKPQAKDLWNLAMIYDMAGREDLATPLYYQAILIDNENCNSRDKNIYPYLKVYREYLTEKYVLDKKKYKSKLFDLQKFLIANEPNNASYNITLLALCDPFDQSDDPTTAYIRLALIDPKNYLEPCLVLLKKRGNLSLEKLEQLVKENKKHKFSGSSSIPTLLHCLLSDAHLSNNNIEKAEKHLIKSILKTDYSEHKLKQYTQLKRNPLFSEFFDSVLQNRKYQKNKKISEALKAINLIQ